jgi:fatty-acid desaturase
MGGAVPLSEHEQRQLEQIEQALYADYPKLAQAVRARDPKIHYKRRVVQAAIGFLLGVGLLLAGVVSKVIFVGVGGFVVMLACAMWALTSWRHMGGARSQRRGRAARKDRRGRAGGTGFMERLEERWRRRQEGDR